jgi:hypothetical protein
VVLLRGLVQRRSQRLAQHVGLGSLGQQESGHAKVPMVRGVVQRVAP